MGNKRMYTIHTFNMYKIRATNYKYAIINEFKMGEGTNDVRARAKKSEARKKRHTQM